MQENELRVLRSLVEQGLVTDPESPRGKLLAKAAHLFKQNGFERTTVRDLAKAIGIQSGSIFHHFKTKQAILKAVLEEAIHFNTALMREALAKTATPKQRMLALVQCELEAITGDTGEAMAILVFEWRCLSEENQVDILKLRDIYEGLWSDAINEAREAGLANGDPFVLRRLLSGALNWTPTWYNREGDVSVKQLAEQVMTLIIKD